MSLIAIKGGEREKGERLEGRFGRVNEEEGGVKGIEVCV